MIELIKGNSEDLEGKVIAYTKFIGNPKDYACPQHKEFLEEHNEGHILALYACTDVTDLLKKVGMDNNEHSKLIKNKLEKSINSKLKKIQKEEPRRILPIYSTLLLDFSEDDIISSDEDVIYVGKWQNPNTCTKFCYHAVNLYVEIFEEQRKEKLRINNDILPNKKAQEETYEQVKSNAGEYIRKAYVVKMMDSQRSQNKKEFFQLQHDFLAFSYQTPIAYDVQSLCILLQKNDGTAKDAPLITAYLDKISAISTENYEEAAKLRDKISTLKNKV